MDNDEKKITRSIAKTFQFREEGNWFKCKLCDKRFSKSYYGKQNNNDRMIAHAKRHGIGIQQPPYRSE